MEGRGNEEGGCKRMGGQGRRGHTDDGAAHSSTGHEIAGDRTGWSARFRCQAKWA